MKQQLDVFSEFDQKQFCAWVKDQWGIFPEKLRREHQISGSPERSLSRAVIEDSRGDLFLVEKFAKEKYPVRHRISKTLYYLNQRGVSRALVSERTKAGGFLPFYQGACFQVTRFLDSTTLKRPDWISSAEMGKEMAGFLIQMKQASQGIGKKISYPPFSIKGYIYQLFRDMKANTPKVHDRYLPILSFLETGFMDAHDSLLTRFCHGDFHPLNVIWDDGCIQAVIDWEFTGIKPDCYDAANLVGCAGIEHPEGLAMPLVTSFIQEVKGAGIISDQGWRYFPEYILALRFAWLSEWLRKEDREMLEMEATFMNILIKHMDELREIWNIGAIDERSAYARSFDSYTT